MASASREKRLRGRGRVIGKIVLMRPGRIKTIFPINLPRPRNLFSREAEAIRIQLTELLRDEVDRAFAEQEEALAATA